MIAPDYLRYPKRRYGMDHDRYDWSMLPDRAPVQWPGGARVALWVTASLQWFPLNQKGVPFKPPGAMMTAYPDLRHYTLRDYGNRVGIYRIMKELRARNISASVPINAAVAARYPSLAYACVDLGWELMGHGLDMDHVHHTGMSDEAQVIERSLDIVRRFAPQAILHTDAVQAACWIDLRTIWPLVDTMALSAHKFGGPKGVGILVVREGKYFEPIVLGGGQERDRRSGTHNVGGIVAAAEALRMTDVERTSEVARISALRDQLFAGLLAIEGAHRTIPAENSVPGVVHVCLQGIESESLLYLLDEADVCASAASACASGAMEPSHVLAAMGLTSDLTMGALRLSLGHTTTEGDVDRAIEAITDAVNRIRAVQNRRSL
mgnify:CR=1 FL=1